jgi:CO dehydrogenase nickel-insertion accessory protein CooC1
MAKIHMILQGKGGVGKSFVAATIAQYKISKAQRPLCIDTDPVNSTFAGYKALNVHRLPLMNGDEIDSRNFDILVEIVAASSWRNQQIRTRVEKSLASISKSVDHRMNSCGTQGESGKFRNASAAKPPTRCVASHQIRDRDNSNWFGQ